MPTTKYTESHDSIISGQLAGGTGIETPDIRVKDSALATMPLIFLSASLLICDLMHSMETVLKLGC